MKVIFRSWSNKTGEHQAMGVAGVEHNLIVDFPEAQISRIVLDIVKNGANTMFVSEFCPDYEYCIFVNVGRFHPNTREKQRGW